MDDPHEIAARYQARVLEIDGPSGPAVARNRGSLIARGDVLVFVDADVVVERSAIERLRSTFEATPDAAAVFGSYDEQPAEPNFVSQYKNLAHAFIHMSSQRVAQTFWAGFGAVRAEAFAAVGGFDERFARPCVEDIDLGYRLTASGRLVLLDHELRSCHLKKWTLKGMVVSDVKDRGIPWTQLILRFGRFNNDLNLKSGYRACVVLSYVLVATLIASIVVSPWFLTPVLPIVAVLLYFGRRFYRFFLRKRGFLFTARVFPLHVLYHLYNGLSFSVGTTLFLARKRFDVALPGSLPIEPWPATALREMEAPRADGPRAMGRDLLARASESATAARPSVRRAGV